MVLDMSTGKGIKRRKNQPVYHDELKERHMIWLTLTAWNRLTAKAKVKNMSVSELLEQMVRNIDGG